MPQLLLELFSEEIPARMQGQAARDLTRLMTEALEKAGVKPAAVQSFAGPRRLTLVIDDLPGATPDVREERKGPRVGAPDKAVEGFLRSAGLESLDSCETREDKKGDFYVAIIEKPGRKLPDVIAEIAPEICRSFPWPKSMRWGGRSERWVRPLRRILCLFDGAVVPFEFAGVKSGNVTEGHRVHGPGPFEVSDFASYRKTLETDGHVLLDAADREARIAEGVAAICKEAGLDWVEDSALLAENAGLAEWPNPILGTFGEKFLDLPDEAIRLTMGKNQKYFAVADPKTGQLAPRFIAVADLNPSDGGGASIKGYERVLTARLEDARFFWEEDLKRPLDQRVDDLENVVFHRKLGSVKDKAERVAALAKELAPVVGADPDQAERAAMLAKADLTTQMVIEFTDLQGVMGWYYARKFNEPDAVANAIREHYKPQGPSDEVPTEPVSVAVALADKLDTLVSFWAIDEKPTGSKDPYALRRAALGVIRLVLENGCRLYLNSLVQGLLGRNRYTGDAFPYEWLEPTKADLLAFFADRLKVALREQGIRHDLIDAVFALGEDDLVAIVKRVEALQSFLATEDGENLLAGYTRAANILKAEEKKGFEGAGAPDGSNLPEPQEKALYDALQHAKPSAEAAIEAEDFEGAMAAIAPLRARIDDFFDAVTVNAEDEGLRRNRLLLLGQIRESLRAVADFDRIESRA
ncbi:glycine--tRNA ligase subunit beta [Euryhalocaulis caribicus]|uniref:glycine--tRNA ligase subunit beta n=1 Tax=Euryhalocaulis caribicus TaxID=1161401 RepID=UPI0003A339EA|nr:glycine--tRNA ligase subunit beta [Euryhalocaulis caribicus]